MKLNFVIAFEPTDFTYAVWVPDTSGAVIGSGESPKDAIADAIANLGCAVAELATMRVPTHDEVIEI